MTATPEQTWSLPVEKTEHQRTFPATMAAISERSQLQPRVAIDTAAILAQLLRPLSPLLSRVTYRRHGARELHPRDILLPTGFVAEVVATGLDAPTGCAFDMDGTAYVFESGHKS